MKEIIHFLIDLMVEIGIDLINPVLKSLLRNLLWWLLGLLGVISSSI
ncbi:hypothetical protein NARC_10196 [Candidatus Nitrosocosmicus arcticus]|uniref:Uncharacterized protein n=1 Tax=Candidatus Nitrosocosmicus arcticus TaxID=2035267 RepID=A0A557SYV5_9ARCH|nr:hypothetical protein NARC_10196 [Candidatus Nitrosocosmicus arcticus]